MLGLLWWGLQTLLLPSLRHSSLLGVCVCVCVCACACVCMCTYMHVCLCMCAHVPQPLQLRSSMYIDVWYQCHLLSLRTHTCSLSMQPPFTVQQPHTGVPPWPVHPATGRNSLSAHKVSVRGLSIGGPPSEENISLHVCMYMYCTYMCICGIEKDPVTHCQCSPIPPSSLFPCSHAYSGEDHQRMALRTWLNVVRGTVVRLDRYVSRHITACVHTSPVTPRV